MKNNKKRLNNKRGISLVVAVALTLVLTLTTTAFIGIAMLQQNETGGELNTRQAYISAKSALDLAKELIDAQSIAPRTTAGEDFYVLYYDASNQLHINKYNTEQEAINQINHIKKNFPNYTIVGNSYIKIKNDGIGNCTITALSTEDKYTNTPGYDRNGDLSLGFTVTIKKEPKYKNVNLEINQQIPQPPSPSSSNRFLMVGAQTSFSLLKSAYYNWSGKQDNEVPFLNTLKQDQLGKDNGNSVINIPYLNTDYLPIDSHFPLIYTNVVQIDSSGNRCTYTAYDDGIYFLGNYTGPDTSDYKGSHTSNVCLYSQAGYNGIQLKCKFITIAHNMIVKYEGYNDYARDGKGAMMVSEYGSTKNGGVVVYFPNDVTLTTYNTDNNEIRCKPYSKGYYWLDTSKGAKNIFNPGDSIKKISDTDQHVKDVANINMYSSLVTKTNGGDVVKNIHAAYESVAKKGEIPVSILGQDGRFNTKEGNTFSKDPNHSYTTKWQDYSIYCAPSKMPSSTGYYNMYCGDTFNYLWYSVVDMEVKDNVKMNIRSNNIVLTIGPDTKEEAYTSNGKITTSVINGTQKGTTAQNTIIGKNNSEFWVRPYWNQNTFKLTVMNNFNVKYSGGEYTVSQGEYTKDLPASGINLLSDAGRDFFTSHSGESKKSDEIGWTDSSGIILNSNPVSKEELCVDFKANGGEFFSGGNYQAKSISLDLTGYNTNTINTNSASLTAEYLTIDTGGKSLKGNALYINTSSGSSVAKLDGNVHKGSIVEVKSDFDIYNDAGEKVWTVIAGTYFFEVNGYVNIMSEDLWSSGNAYIVNGANKHQIGTKTKTITTFNEGRYF